MQPSLPRVLVASYWCYEGCNCKFNSDLELSKTVQLLDSFSHFLSHCNYIIQIFDTFACVSISCYYQSLFQFVQYYVKLFFISKNFGTNHSQLFPYLTILFILSELSFLCSILLLHILQLHPKQNGSSIF